MPDEATGLTRKTRQGLAWTAAGALASNVVRLGVFAALGRLLAPADFGLVAAAMVVIQLGSLMKDLGVGLALVQRKELEPEHVEAANTFSILLGVALSAIVFAAAGPISAFFDMEDSVWIVRVLGSMFALRGFALVPGFMLRRAMSFRAVALVDVAGYITGSLLSVILALGGFGVWALVWGYVLEIAINVVLLYAMAPLPSRRLRLHRRHLRELLGFGLGKSLANLGNYFANQGDYMVIGRVLDKTQLGLYQRAYELVRFPANIFSSIAGGVLFSAFSKVQDEPERLGRAFRRAMFGSALVLLPASIGLIVIAPEVIQILLGDQWSGVVWPFRVMAITMLFRTTYKLSAMVGRSAGQVFKIAGWQFVYAALVIGGATISIRWDILGVAATTALAVTLNFFAMTRLGIRMTDLRARDLFAAHVTPLGFAAAVGGTTWLCASALRELGAHHVAVAAITTIAGGVTFLVLAWFGIRRGTGDWPWLEDTLVQTLRRKRKTKRAPDAENIEC